MKVIKSKFIRGEINKRINCQSFIKSNFKLSKIYAFKEFSTSITNFQNMHPISFKESKKHHNKLKFLK